MADAVKIMAQVRIPAVKTYNSEMEWLYKRKVSITKDMETISKPVRNNIFKIKHKRSFKKRTISSASPPADCLLFIQSLRLEERLHVLAVLNFNLVHADFRPDKPVQRKRCILLSPFHLCPADAYVYDLSA